MHRYPIAGRQRLALSEGLRAGYCDAQRRCILQHDARRRLTAAQIIVAAGKACGISPKVLMVMLQKEQGLITATSPGDQSYNAALGQACSDTAPCDPAYAGFVNQVYGGARQLRMYLAVPTGTRIRLAGTASSITRQQIVDARASIS